MSKPRRILIVGPAWVGDTVMAQGLFRLLKQREPDAIIDVIAPDWTASILSHMPEINRTILLPITHGEFKLAERFRQGKALRAAHYDQAIVLPNSWKSALIPFFAGIPKRTGWVGEFRHLLLNDARRLDKKRYPKMIMQYLALGLAPDEALPQELPYPMFVADEAAQKAVLAKHNIPWSGKPVLALCAGAEFGPSKRWPESYYADVANQKIAEGWDVWLFGSPKDKPITAEIMQLTQNRCENLAGRLLLAETIDLLSLTSGVVTNDSGLMHVAAALEKPLIAIYGSTSPDFTPPLGREAHVLKLNLPCQPCFERTCPLLHHKCMLDIKPERVLAMMSGWSK